MPLLCRLRRFNTGRRGRRPLQIVGEGDLDVFLRKVIQ